MQSDQEKLVALEREIDQATERLWEAKLAFKKAKVLVKTARKDRKQLRKEHMRLQEQLGEATNPAAPARKAGKSTLAGTLKVADSPEKTKTPRKKVKISPPAQNQDLAKEDPAAKPTDVAPQE